MSDNWNHCRRLLCIRADNMGDVIMTGPALRALKETFGCHITLLTSTAAAGIVSCIKEIDDAIIADLPWVKQNATFSPGACVDLINKISNGQFDGAVIFTVYSQSSLPAAMLAFLAGIPNRLAYCRENPYGLLTNWLPDQEPYNFIVHQVERDLALVKEIGAVTKVDQLMLDYPSQAQTSMLRKLQFAGVDTARPWLLLHPGVSEEKRMYPQKNWQTIIRLLQEQFDAQFLLSGTQSEAALALSIAGAWHNGDVHVIAGLLNIAEFISCVQHSRLVVTVNTATTHIAAAVQTPQVVLYATTNPQHTPWKAPASVLYFPVEDRLASRNEIIKYAAAHWQHDAAQYPSPLEIVQAVKALLNFQKISA